ncbi:MAG: hypothetical protein ABUT20_53495, partial [Bacteroidota bacterium]
MSLLVLDIAQLFQQQFGGKPYKVTQAPQTGDDGSAIFKINRGPNTITTDLQTVDSKGTEIWLPLYFEDLPKEVGDNGKLFLPYTVVRISGSSNWVRTPLAERRGSAKE